MIYYVVFNLINVHVYIFRTGSVLQTNMGTGPKEPLTSEGAIIVSRGRGGGRGTGALPL